jgi:hypothetical protein
VDYSLSWKTWCLINETHLQVQISLWIKIWTKRRWNTVSFVKLDPSIRLKAQLDLSPPKLWRIPPKPWCEYLDLNVRSGNYRYWRGRHTAVDALVVTSLDEFLLLLQTFFKFFTKQAILMRRSTILSLSLQLVFHGQVVRQIAAICPDINSLSSFQIRPDRQQPPRHSLRWRGRCHGQQLGVRRRNRLQRRNRRRPDARRRRHRRCRSKVTLFDDATGF